MFKYMKMLGGALLVSFVAACGGGGGSAGATPGSVPPGTAPPLAAAASIEVFASSAQLSSATGSTASFTVVVKDANNQAIPNQTVTFSASSGNLIGALPAPRTGAAGEAITSVTLSAGSNQSNRDIVVTATAGGVSRSITVAVQGTALSVAGDSAVLAGGSTTFTAKALDSAGRAIAGATLSITSSLGNTINPRAVVTDGQGAATFSYLGNGPGLDTLTVTGLGTAAKAAVSVSADNFRFETPTSNTSIAVGSTLTATVRFLSGGLPVSGRQVVFSSTRGSVLFNTAVTDAEGRASTVVSSSTSGPASIIAQIASAQATLPVVFVAITPATLVLQANPGSVPPNAAGSTALNQSALQAVVRDVAGNPVAGQVVNFTAITDGSNGTISPGSGVTDANGTVVAQFIPGALTTSNNGVVIRAAVQGSSVANTAFLTVSGQALFISIASNNEIGNLNATTYQKEFAVYVTDANGAPAASRVINLSVFADSYAKGTLTFVSPSWRYTVNPPTTCANEDELGAGASTRRNGILDPGEDINGNGRLTPGLPVVVSPAAVTTSATGFATFFLQYGENFANWVGTTVTARASVGGTESIQTARYFLSASVSDMTNETVPPASQVSPFGIGTTCVNPN